MLTITFTEGTSEAVIMTNACRYSKICLDSYDGENMKGFISNPFYPKSISFDSTIDFLMKMQDMIEEMDYPKPYRLMRSFEASQVNLSSDSVDSGKLATFVVKVLFCQNSSWQGTISLRKGENEQTFRSALELLFMMNSAIKSNSAN